MKIILSRKGFDTSSGKAPSPIFEDPIFEGKTLLSIPIPSEHGNITYQDIRIPNNIKEYLSKNNVQIETYEDLLLHLLRDYPFKFKKNEKYCHVDPDLIKDVLIKRKDSEHWLPAFGQNRAAATTLRRAEIRENDLFLFFGLFRETNIYGGRLYYHGKTLNKHIIYGYLQVGKVLENENRFHDPKHQNEYIENYIPKNSWLETHPHTTKEFLEKDKNLIFIAKPTLSFNEKYTGAGYFKYSDDLVLTETNPVRNPKKKVSFWRCNKSLIEKDFYIKNEERYFKSSRPQWQEHVTLTKEMAENIKNFEENSMSKIDEDEYKELKEQIEGWEFQLRQV